MSKQTNSNDEYINRVRNDHYIHKAVMLLLAIYGWQLHGFLMAILILIALYIIISLSNLIVMAISSDKNVLRNIRFNRWGWVAIAYALVAISGASIETVQATEVSNAAHDNKE